MSQEPVIKNLLKDLNEQQQAVVQALDHNVLVNAGAGTGKTHTLTQRFVYILLKDPTVSPREILAITYTDAAAAELRARIQNQLRLTAQDATLSAEEARRLTHHARLMDSAWISTIHAFCARIIRAHAFELGIDPGFSQLDGDQARYLRTDIIDRFVDSVKPEHAQVVTATLTPVAFLGVADQEVDQAIEKAPTGALYSALVMRGYTHRMIAENISDLSEVVARSGVTFFEIESQPWTCAQDRRHEHTILEAKMIIELTRRAQAAYAALKEQQGILDFTDLIMLAHRLLSEHEHVRRSYRNRFKYIMIDEFQDTNPVLYDIVTLLAQDNLCLVGDAKQSIFGFSGADVSIINELTDTWPRHLSSEVIELSINYRSTPQVLEFANVLCADEHLLGSDMQILEAGRDMDAYPALKQDLSAPVSLIGVGPQEVAIDKKRNHEATLIARHFKMLHELADIALGDMTVLVRTHKDAERMLDTLERHGLHGAINGGKSYYQEPIVAELLALLRLIRNPHDDQAFITVALSVAGNISDSALDRIGHLVKDAAQKDEKGWISLYEAALEFIRISPEDDPNTRNIMHLAGAFDRASQMLGRYPISEILTTFYRDRGVLDYWAQRNLAHERDRANFRKFMRIADDFAISGGNPIEFIERIEQARDLRTDSNIGQWLTTDSQRVNVVTIHKAKGLQYRVVAFLGGSQKPRLHSGALAYYNDPRPDMQDAIRRSIAALPHTLQEEAAQQWERQSVGKVIYMIPAAGKKDKAKERQDALIRLLRTTQFSREYDELKRHLYVAVTRAQDHVVMTYHTTDMHPAHTSRNLGQVLTDIAGTRSEKLDCDIRSSICSISEPVTDESSAPVQPSQPLAAEHVSLRRLTPAPTSQQRYRLVQVSASQVLAFHQCPWRYWWVYANRLTIDPDTVWRDGEEHEGHLESSAAHRGTVLHKLFEVIPADPDVPLDRKRLDTILAASGIPPGQFDEVVASLQAYRVSALNQEVLSYPTIHREYQFYTAIESYYLYGFMDVLAVDEKGDVLIIDYKVSFSTQDKSKIFREQARFYAYVALAQGAQSVRVVFAQINADEVVAYDTDCSFTRADIADLQTSLLTDITAMETVQTAPPDTHQGALCGHCRVPAALCRWQATY